MAYGLWHGSIGQDSGRSQSKKGQSEDMGRNIFQSDKPIGMIKAVRAIVHENASVDEAYGIYQDGPVGL